MDILKYVMAGNATFSLYSIKLGRHYTYKIQRDKKNVDRYFCKVLYGQDNEKDYRYIGLFYKDNLVLRSSPYPDVWCNQPSVMLSYFLMILKGKYEWPSYCIFYPSGKCAVCGRTLTTPESIERGIGPTCWEVT